MEKVFFMKEITAGPPKNIYQYWKTKLPGLRQFLAALILALWPKYGLEHHLPSSSRTQISNKAYLHDLNFLPIRTMQGKQSLWNSLIYCYFGVIWVNIDSEYSYILFQSDSIQTKNIIAHRGIWCLNSKHSWIFST